MAVVTRQLPKPKGKLPPPRPQARDVSPPKNNNPAFTIFHYGPSGCGKTSMWAFLPDVGFIFDPKETGILDLASFKQCPIPKWHEMTEGHSETLNLLADVANHKFKIKSLVMDSATGFELQCFRHHCKEHFDNDWSKEGFYAFQQGPKNAAKTDWPDLLDALDEVNRSGINVVLLGHSQVKSVARPGEDNYDQYMPYLDKETWAQTHRWAKAVFFHNIEVGFTKEGRKTKVVVDSECRAIYTQPSAVFNAKNRWGLPLRIDGGNSPQEAYENFVKAYRKVGGVV